MESLLKRISCERLLTPFLNVLPEWQMILIPAFAMVALMLFLFDPATYDFYPQCPFNAWTGLYCPGCGTLRAISRLLHGDLPGAFGYNPFSTVVIPLTGLFLMVSRLSGGFRSIPEGVRYRMAAWGGQILFLMVLVFWVARNIPLAPFSMLAPH